MKVYIRRGITAILFALLILAVLFIGLPHISFASASDATSEDPSVIDFTTKMEGYKWSFTPYGSSNENLANRPKSEIVQDGDVDALKLPKDVDVNWSIGAAALRYKGETAAYNNIEYKFRLKLDGSSYSGMIGQLSLFSEKDPTKWGNNAEYGYGVYAQLYDGHTVVLNYRSSEAGDSSGTEIGRVQFFADEMKGQYVNFNARLREADGGTYATVRVQDYELVNEYFCDGMTGKGYFGIVSGNADADIYLAPYNYYSVAGLQSDREPALEGINLQDFINKGYPNAVWMNGGGSMNIENHAIKIVSNGGFTIRTGSQHYSTAISDTSYNFRVKVESNATIDGDAITFLQRLTGDTGSGQITSAYGVYFHQGGDVILARYANNIDGRTQLASASKVIYDGAVHDISFATKNVTEGVLLTVYADGEKLLEYTDTADEKITTKGQFVIDSHYGDDTYYIAGYDLEKPYESDGDDTPVYGVGDTVPQENWTTAETVLNINDLVDESSESAWILSNGTMSRITEGEGVSNNVIRISAGEDENNGTPFYYAGAGARQFKDYTMSFNLRQTYKVGKSDWATIITLRDSAPGTGDWDSAKPTGYDLVVFNNRICLRRIINGTDSGAPGAGEIPNCSYNIGLVDGEFHEYTITIMNEGSGVRIVLYLDGVLAINYLDTDYPATGSGYVSFFFGQAVATSDIMAGSLEHYVEPDTQPPVITVPSDKPTTGTVGEEITLPVGTLSDNVTDPALMIITRTVVDPDGTPVQLSNRKFTPTKAGTYVVTYTAEDEAGNTGETSWNIVVSAAGGNGGNGEDNGGAKPDLTLPLALTFSGIFVIIVVVVAIVLVKKRKSRK